ncbi:hypothetical protein SERLADRAFT_406220 [Serpula lacrymans var. lacrymans S7.9]|uniref:Uncharacterized protein n=1 Tax=Serpula lacrymans var. lacrymans (strain S7.9) TaxID=578457 RepID=F8NKV6_SERL9|nr:uncharacterized protein SERLADRAFT_406220 [Serpula lacrymans var. lacrymans S7.9]EGO28825.1 hypothetical protein SERLADRAFT_406220 [Serpula lacrymans var. lacrymans S7.9]
MRRLPEDTGGLRYTSLWGDHLWEKVKQSVSKFGKTSIDLVDKQFQEFPRWCDINHFDKVMNILFSDGSKLEDIAKVHTEQTIKKGREELQKWLYLITYSCVSGKSWNFPKAHLHAHVFDDIEAKGVTQNYNTKPNKKLHGPLKKSYTPQSDGKQVADQHNPAFKDLCKKLVKFLNNLLPAYDITLPNNKCITLHPTDSSPLMESSTLSLSSSLWMLPSDLLGERTKTWA